MVDGLSNQLDRVIPLCIPNISLGRVRLGEEAVLGGGGGEGGL